MIAAIHAEWTKLRTVSSSAWLVVAIAGFTVGLGAAMVGTVDTDMCPTPAGCIEDTTKLSLGGVWAGQIAVAVLAVLAMTNEYGNRMIGVSLTARPRRLQVFSAKLAVVSAIVLIAGAAGIAGSLLVGRFVLPGNGFTSANGYDSLSLAAGLTMRAAVGTMLYLGLIAVLSIGLGAMIRDSAVALIVVFALMFVVPMVSEFVSDPQWHERLQRMSPTTAGLSIQATERLDELAIGPWRGLGVLGLYALGAALAGYIVLRIRDA